MTNEDRLLIVISRIAGLTSNGDDPITGDDALMRLGIISEIAWREMARNERCAVLDPEVWAT